MWRSVSLSLKLCFFAPEDGQQLLGLVRGEEHQLPVVLVAHHLTAADRDALPLDELLHKVVLEVDADRVVLQLVGWELGEEVAHSATETPGAG